MITYNPILNTDSYKTSMYRQIQIGSEYTSSYIESRGTERGWDELMVYGIQMFLKEYMSVPITQEHIEYADEFLTAHGEPFNREGWEYIVNNYDGMMPLSIQSVPEGTVLPLSNVIVQVINTDKKLAWLTTYIEQKLLRAVWYPSSVATQDMYIKRTIKRYMDKTSCSETADADMMFKLHDFGGRGVSSYESAGIGGSAHLVNFMGTDTLTGALFARVFYNEHMAGFSIPATEHSTMTSWGGEAGEIDAFKNFLDEYLEEGKTIACVSDSYSIMDACDKWFTFEDRLKNSGGTLVIRPDSGVPEEIVTQVISKLMTLFGYTTNEKGYKVLPPYIRVLQGDGINGDSIDTILHQMVYFKQSADNIAFGMGGAMLQMVHRDTQEFAMKNSASRINGKWIDVYKDPITDSGKRSKKGRLALVKNAVGDYQTKRESALIHQSNNLLRTVWENGVLLIDEDFSTIRERAASQYM